MAKQIQFKSLDNIGLNGLNTQSNPASLDASFLTKAENIVIRESGRISFRKGLKQQILANTFGSASAPLPIGSLVEFNNGSAYKYFAGIGTQVYEIDFTTPDTPYTSASLTGITDDDWQFIKFNENLYAVQAGHAPLEYNKTANTWDLLENNSSFSGSSSWTTFDPSCALGFYGRVWAGGITENDNVVWYSDLLLANKWGTSGAGYLDLKTVWGQDIVVGIAAFYGKIVFFGENNIAIYNNPTDPKGTDFVLDEVIRGVGCVSRDTIVNVGDDLLFLSKTGMKSLYRTSQKDKVPLQDLSRNITDTIIRLIDESNNMKSVYVENEGIVLLTFVDLNITYVFDLKHKVVSDFGVVPRITKWTFNSDRGPTCFKYTNEYNLLIGQTKGSICTYEGYYDKEYVSGGTHNSYSYTGTLKTIWIDLGEGVIASLLKEMKAVIEGGQGATVTVKWYTDYSTQAASSQTFALNPIPSGTTYLWGSSSSLYGAAKYAPYYALKEYNIPLSRSAKVLAIEMIGVTAGYVASLQDLSLLYKQGKIR